MRWVFYSLLTLNLVYLIWGLVNASVPTPDQSAATGVEVSAPQRLTLLSEAGKVPASESAPARRQQLCPVVGPWDGVAGAEQALSTLRTAGYRGQIRAVEVQKERLSWVYLPAYPSRDEALRVLRELQARGVDSFIVGQGEDQNAISLGYFASEESAEGLRMKMNNAGYPARVRETGRQVTEYWLYLDRGSIEDEGSALRDYIAATQGLEADHSDCGPAVAADPAAPEAEPQSAPQT
jgi:hypothetical protein